MAERRVAVIGAGLAGLAATLELVRAGFDVEIFERSRLLGGRATSFHIDGLEVDNGQHVFLGCCTEFMRFVRDVGMADRLRVQDRFEALVFARGSPASRLRAAALPAPWHLVASFLGYRHLDWLAKWNVVVALSRARGLRRDGGSFAHWLGRNRQGKSALRAFWEPFFVPALNAPLDKVSAADAGFVMSTAFLGDARGARFGYSTVPLAHIAAAAAHRATCVHLNSGVIGIGVERGVAEVALSSGERLSFDAVVAAVSPPQLARLLGDAARFGLPDLAGYDPYPVVDVHLWHDKGSLGFDFAAVLDSPVQWVFEKCGGYLCCSISAASDQIRLPASELIDACWNELIETVPGMSGARLVRGSVTRNPEATFVARPGIKRPGPMTAHRNVAIAGSWTDTGWPDTMESAVRSGRAAARAIEDSMRGSNVA